MAKKVQKSNDSQLVDVAAFVLSAWYVYSVVNNARDLVAYDIKNAPASYALVLALALVGFSWYKRQKLSAWSLVSLAVLTTAVVIWLFGLSANSMY